MHTRILAVDAEPARAERPVELLRASGFEVMMAFSASVAYALMQLFPPDIVLLDSALAEQLLPALHRWCPAARVLLTGDAEVDLEQLKEVVRRSDLGECRPVLLH